MSALLKYIQLKTSAIIGDIKDGQLIASEPMLIMKIRELYPSYRDFIAKNTQGNQTFTEYVTDLKKNNEEDDFLRIFSHEVEGYAKELWKNQRFEELFPSIIRKWNKWLFEDIQTQYIKVPISKDEMPKGMIVFNPVQNEEDELEKMTTEGFDEVRKIFQKSSPAQFNYQIQDEFNIVAFSKRTNSFSAFNKNSFVHIPIDPYEFFDKSGLGQFSEKKVLFGHDEYNPHIIEDKPNVDSAYINKVRDEVAYVQEKKDFKHFFQNIDLLPLIYETDKATSISANLKTDVTNQICFEIEFNRVEKLISVVPVMDFNYACKILFQIGKGRVHIYYDENNEKLILVDVANPELFVIVNNVVGDIPTFGSISLMFHQAGLSIREKERLMRSEKAMPLHVPAELLKKKPLLAEMAKVQMELLTVAEQDKTGFYSQLLKKCTEYVDSYTTWDTDKDSGARVRVGIVDDTINGKTNYDYVYSVEEIFWNYNSKMTIEEVLAYFVSKGNSTHFRKLSQRIIGIDYFVFFDQLIDLLIENKMLAIEEIKVNQISKVIEKLQYKYIYEYASGNVYAKKEKLLTVKDKDGDIVIKGMDEDIYAYFGYEMGTKILENQQEILDDSTPTPCKLITAKEDKNKKLELSINNEIFFEKDEDNKILPIQIITRTHSWQAPIYEHFETFVRSGKVRILGGISQSEIKDGYIKPMQKRKFISEYILPNWKPKPINDTFTRTAITLWVLVNEFGKKADDFQMEGRGGKMKLDKSALKSLSREEKVRINQVYEDIIAKYNETASKIQVEGDRLFDIFLRNEVSAGMQTRIEDLWNKAHNNFAIPNIEKIPIFVETGRYFGANTDTPFSLRKAQADGLKNYVSRKNSHLLAHDVGFGKSSTGIASITHLFNTGQASRVLLLVPNAVYTNWIKEIKGDKNERGVAPFLNIIELYNAHTPAIKPLKVLSDDEKVVADKFKIFRANVLKYIGKKDFGILEFNSGDIEKVQKILEKEIPKWKTFYAFNTKDQAGDNISFIESIERIESEYKKQADNKISEEEGGKSGMTKSRREQIYGEFEKEYTNELLVFLQIKERGLIDELGYYKEEVLKPNSVILATHEALSELRAKQENIHDAIAFVDDVEGYFYASESVRKWMKYLPNNPISLDKLKIDAIIVDEVHNYNELINKTRKRYLEEVSERKHSRSKEMRYFYTTGTGGGGGKEQHLLKYNSTGDYTSADKLNLLSIVLEIQRNNKIKSGLDAMMNSMMLSATPFTDTPFQMLSVFGLTNIDALKEYGLASAYKFFENFVVEEWKFDITHDDKYGLFAKIERYRNGIALSNFIKTFADFKISDKVIDEARPKKFTLPDLENKIVGAEGVDSSVPMSDLQEEVKQLISDFVAGKISKKEICPFGSSAGNDVDTMNQDIPAIASSEELVLETTDTEEAGEDEEKSEYGADSLIEGGNVSETETEKARALLGMRYQQKLVMSPYFFICESGRHIPLPNLDETSKNPIKVKDKDGKIIEVDEYDLGAKNFVEHSPKFMYVSECVKTVLDYHKNSRKDKGIPSNQVIYLNTGKKFKYMGVDYDAFELIRRYIGQYRTDIDINVNEIGIIHGGISLEERKKIQDEFNSGRLKLLIGSSAIREGVNLQKNSTVMYITQAEYAPSIAMQLEGRIWRQGNKWANVRMVYVLAFNSLDAFVYSKLQRKIHSIRTMLEGGVYDMNKTQFTIDADEMKMHLITDANRLSTLKWQEEVKVYRSKLEEQTSILDTLKNVKKQYPQVQKSYEDFLLKVNLLSEVLDESRLEDLRKEIRKEQGFGEKSTPKKEKRGKGKGKEEKKSKSTGELTDAEIDKMIADGIYKKHYEHVHLDKNSNFAIFLQKLNVIKANYKNAKQFEKVKDDVQAERNELELPLEEMEEGSVLIPVLEEVETVKKEKKKGKWEIFYDTLIKAGYKDTDDFLKEADLFAEGGAYDIILGTYSSEVLSKGLQFTDLDSVMKEYQEKVDEIMDYIGDEKKQLKTLKTFFEKKIEERKKSGKFTLEEQVEKFKKTNSLIVLKSEVNA